MQNLSLQRGFELLSQVSNFYCVTNDIETAFYDL